MKVIGLTGGIGSGKSTVSTYLIKKGFEVIDADLIAREIVSPGSDVLDELAMLFGSDIINNKGCLDRKKLAVKVFGNIESKRNLDHLMHKNILSVIDDRLEKYKKIQDKDMVVVDAALMFETELYKRMDMIWLVEADRETRVQRVMRRDERSREDVLKLIENQMDDDEKEARANVVIDNSGSEEELYQQIDELIDDYA